jgi:hypothetical protein
VRPHAGFLVPAIAGGLAANFDGAANYANRGGALTGVVNSQKGLFSVWLTPQSSAQVVLNNNGGSGNSNGGIRITAGNKIHVSTIDSSGSSTPVIIDSDSTVTIPAPAFHHYLVSWDSAFAPPKAYVYIDDVAVLSGGSTVNGTDSDYAGATDWFIGAIHPGSAEFFNGCIAELWFDPSKSLDLSVVSNRRKFITAGLHPAIVGADGSTPTGTAPPIYMADGKTNTGTGGAFTFHGTANACDVSP